MEVHHSKVEKKNFKEYLLEGLMIFLAVTLGFFAENLRESVKDSTEIKNNIQSMIGDLQTDVDMFNTTISITQLSDRRIDTLISLLKSDRSHTQKIYFLARFTTANNVVYTPDTKTFDQMKSSGTLRLIESHSVADSISDYYQSLQFFKSQSDLQRQKVIDVHEVNSQLFDGSVFQVMFTNIDSVVIQKPDHDPPLLSDDFNAINKVMVAYHYLYATTEINNDAAEVSRQHALRLIDFLKKEYHIK